MQEQEKQTAKGRDLYEWVQSLVGSVLVVVAIFTFVIRMMGVDGHSMLNTLQHGDRLLVVNSMLYHDYKYGDIVILRKNGVKVVSARESIAEDSTGILLESVLEGYAEFFSAELSEKVRRGMKENALKCKSNGCSIPMGYVVDSERHFQIDPVAAPIVQEVFNQYAEGATMKEIADGLNAKGIRSSRGGPISLNIISHMLKNRRYLGEYRYGDIVTPGGMPVIISEELFERAQERMKQNKKAPARHKAEDDYLLTTKLYCGKCGAFMVGESGTSHTAKIYRYYKCTNTKQRKTCDKKAVQKDWIENFVVSRIMQELMHDDELERLIDALLNLQSKESRELPLLERQLAEGR